MNAGMLFMRYGVKSMTMDEIARQLGISKKTLYQFVDNKKDLVTKVVSMQIDHEQCCIQEVFDNTVNAIDELMEITRLVSSHLKEMHSSVMFDVKKYHIEAYQIIQEHKNKFMYKNIKKNLEFGIKTGMYRENLNPEIVTHLYLSMVNNIMDPDNETQRQFSTSELYTEIMRYHIRGIASAKGREYLKQKFNQENV